MNYTIFEDNFTQDLKPFTINHASFEMRCGAFSGIERIINALTENDSLTLIVREEIEGLIRERFPKYSVNPQVIGKGVCLNGASIWSKDSISGLPQGKEFSANDKLVAIVLEESESLLEFRNNLESRSQVTTQIKTPHISYLWDTIFISTDLLIKDSSQFSANKYGFIHPSAVLENEEEIFTGNRCTIKAGVVIDATKGPVILMDDVTIDIGSLIQGPVFIGEGCIINPGAKLRGNVVLGNMCKIGGEVEDSIFHGFSNKQHDGFIGHSYIGEWVNLGANTNNSDLKNNYGWVKVDLGHSLIDSKKQFLGSLIGDYTRTGISTMINTGTYIGLGANVFGSDFQDKHIPSFAWGRKETVDVNKFLSTLKTVKERRNIELSDLEKDFIIKLSTEIG